MRADIKIPAMGESISEATVGKFLKQTGAQVAENEEIVELETEKVNQVLYAPASGVLTWDVKEGDSLSIGSHLGFIERGAAPQPTETKKEAAPQPQPKPVAPEPIQKEKKKTPSEPRKAKDSFVAELKGEKSSEKPPQEVKEEKKVERRRMSKIRQTIAKRLVKSLHESAMLTTFNEVDMSAIQALREKYKDSFANKYGIKLGFMSFFVKAVVEAIKTFPEFNAYIEGDEIVQNPSIDIGIAVSTERGLIVPVIRRCDHLSFAEIEKSIVNFAKKARDGALTLDDLRGGSFTITNGGVFGSLLSTPILNPPQVGILGMHKIMKRAVVVGDAIVIRPMMYLALSYDHRLIDGKEAVTFLIKIKEVLEDPSQLLYLEGE